MNEQLEQRISRLESENRRLRRCFGTAAVLIFTLIVGGGASLLAQPLLIRDNDGKVRVFAGVNEQNPISSGIDISDANGRRRIMLSITNEDKAVLVLWDADGNVKKVVSE